MNDDRLRNRVLFGYNEGEDIRKALLIDDNCELVRELEGAPQGDVTKAALLLFARAEAPDDVNIEEEEGEVFLPEGLLDNLEFICNFMKEVQPS